MYDLDRCGVLSVPGFVTACDKNLDQNSPLVEAVHLLKEDMINPVCMCARCARCVCVCAM